MKILDIFMIKLGQYPIILEIPQFMKHFFHMCFDQNTVIFNSSFFLQNCYSTGWAITVNGVKSQFDFFLCYPTLLCQAVDFSCTNEFISDSYSRFLTYHYFCLCLLLAFTQVVRDSSTGKSLNCCFHLCFYLLFISLSMSLFFLTSLALSLSSQIFVAIIFS